MGISAASNQPDTVAYFRRFDKATTYNPCSKKSIGGAIMISRPNKPRPPLLKTPSLVDGDPIIRRKMNESSRSAKKINAAFSEYEWHQIKPIDFFEINLEVTFSLRKKYNTEKVLAAIASLERSLLLDNALSPLDKDGVTKTIVFRTDNLLNVKLSLIERIEKKLDKLLCKNS